VRQAKGEYFAHTGVKVAISTIRTLPYLERGANVVTSIPGYKKIVEFLSLTKQLVDIRAKRGV
jgi:hypothetical protein